MHFRLFSSLLGMVTSITPSWYWASMASPRPFELSIGFEGSICFIAVPAWNELVTADPALAGAFYARVFGWTILLLAGCAPRDAVPTFRVEHRPLRSPLTGFIPFGGKKGNRRDRQRIEGL